jgi:2-amino-4-hydroxy-6-hydroxymethyldihydropteridine diphosphokinase
MRDPVVAYVGIGANLGDAQRTVREAMASLRQLPGVESARASSIYLSAPVDAGGPDFANAVMALTTREAAPVLLGQLQKLERAAGRERPYRNAPRTLDLDLLLYGGGRIDSATLTVPHPRMRERAFVLRPLAELAPALVSEADLARVAAQRITVVPAA